MIQNLNELTDIYIVMKDERRILIARRGWMFLIQLIIYIGELQIIEFSKYRIFYL